MPAEPFTLPVEKGSVIPINEDPTDGGRDFDYFPGYVGQQVLNLATGSVYVATGVTADDWLSAGVASGIPQGGPLSQDLDADGNTITNLPDPSGAQDADTQAARDAAIAAAVFDGGTVHHTIIVEPTGADEPSLKIGESTEPPDDGAHSQLFTDGGELKLKKEDNSVVMVGGGGSSPFERVRRSVLYSDFVDSLISPGSYKFAPLHEFAAGDVIVKLGFICTVTFADGDGPLNGLSFQMTDDGNAEAYNSLNSAGVANTNGPLAILENSDNDTDTVFAAGETTMPMSLVTAPLAIGLCDNGSLADSVPIAGAFEVCLIYVPAP